MDATSFLKVLIFIAPLFYNGFGKPSPHSVDHSGWTRIDGRNRYNERRNERRYHEDDGWITIGSKDDWRHRERYTDSKSSNYQNDWKYPDSKHDRQNANNGWAGSNSGRQPANYHDGRNNHGRGNDWYNTNWNGYTHDSSVAGNVPIKNDWRYYNGTVGEDEEIQESKKAKIQVKPQTVRQDWWHKANSDARWDSQTGDLWKDPKGPAGNANTSKTSSIKTTLESNSTESG